MKGYYDPVLSKEDPLCAIHVKVPKSIFLILKSEAKIQRRYPAEVARQIIIEWEKTTRAEREERMEAAGANGLAGKRKRA